MVKEIVQNKYLGVFILVMGLIAVRIFQSELFYDPLLTFFRGNFQGKPLPEYNVIKLLFYLFLRYFVNSLLSVAIIYLLFKNKNNTQLSVVLYTVFAIGLFSAITFLLINYKPTDYMSLFYIRRFIIQPYFLLIFIPALYYTNYHSK